MLFPVVNSLKCVVTEVVFFSIVAFKTLDISQGSVILKYFLKILKIIIISDCLAYYTDGEGLY